MSDVNAAESEFSNVGARGKGRARRVLVSESPPEPPFLVRNYGGAIYVSRLEPQEMAAIAAAHGLVGLPVADIDREWIKGLPVTQRTTDGVL